MRVNICIILALINVVTIYGTDNSDDRSRTLLRKMIARRREVNTLYYFILPSNNVSKLTFSGAFHSPEECSKESEL